MLGCCSRQGRRVVEGWPRQQELVPSGLSITNRCQLSEPHKHTSTLHKHFTTHQRTSLSSLCCMMRVLCVGACTLPPPASQAERYHDQSSQPPTER